VPIDPSISAELCSALCIVLKEAREELELSLGEVSGRASLNRQAVAFIEQDERSPTSETLVRHAVALGLRPSEAWARAEAKLSSKWWRQLQSSAKSKM
jgi:transcriptional regulator with XRE-family HTH domain